MRQCAAAASATDGIILTGPPRLLDEADTYLGLTIAKQHEDLRGLVNAGHRGASDHAAR